MGNDASPDVRSSAASPTTPTTPATPIASPTRQSTSRTLEDNNNSSNAIPSNANRTRASSSASKTSTRIRGASNKFMESNPPSGFMAATGEIAGKAPTLSNIRHNSYGSKGSRRGSFASAKEGRDRGDSTVQTPNTPTLKSPTIPEMEFNASDFGTSSASAHPDTSKQENKRNTRDFADMVESGEYDLGRGKMNNQSYVKSATGKPREPAATASGHADDADADADDGDDDSLFELDPKPKRRSKNMSAMLGEDVDTQVPTTNKSASGSKRNTRDFADMIENGEYDLGRGKLNDQSYTPSARPRKTTNTTVGTDFDGAQSSSEDTELKSSPKRHSKNLDTMYGSGATQQASTHVVATTSAAGASQASTTDNTGKVIGPDENGYYPNGYHFPPKKTWKESTVVGLKASWKFLYANWYNWLIVLYGLNVVAWGGMLFLLLIGGGKAMCWTPQHTYNCDDLYAPRRIWVEIDSQILNALFCVTGFGLAPWRFRDLWYLMKWRIGKKYSGLRRLAGLHNGWFRLPGSQELPLKVTDLPDLETNPAIPIPAKQTPPEPLTAMRAPPTPLWKMDFVVWLFVWNTFLQVVLSFFMWHLNRFDRPSWSTGLFVALACIVAAIAGVTQLMESNKIKKVEGVPLPDDNGNVDRERDMETTRAVVVDTEEKKAGSNGISNGVSNGVKDEKK